MTNESIWDKVDSIEKRFENRLDKSNVKFNTLNPVWDNERGDALNVFEMIDELIRLNLDYSNLIDDNTEYVAEINQIHKENEQLKSKNRGLQSELQIFKEDVTHSNLQINKLADENEQLKKDATTLIYANQDYRHENENLKKQLDYIQNSINEHIKHQKTELAAKALKEIIEDYNEWMLGHKEAKK